MPDHDDSVVVPSALDSRASSFDPHDSLLICIASKIATTYCLAHRYTQKLSIDDTIVEGDPEPNQRSSSASTLNEEQRRASSLMKHTINDATEWLLQICQQLNVDLRVLPDDPGDNEGLKNVFSESKADDVAFELVLVSIGLGESAKAKVKEQNASRTARSWLPGKDASSSSTTDASPPLDYTALSRSLVVRTAQVLDIHEDRVLEAERAISQALYFELQAKEAEQQKDEKKGKGSEWDEAAQAYKKEQGGMNSALKWGATAAGFVAGGAIIGLTGGLAAPAIAPLLAGTLGIGIFAGSGGIILIGTLLGLGGGGLAGYRTHRRMEGLKEVTFEPVVDPDIPVIPSLTATIVASGFLLDLSDSIVPWLPSYRASPTDTYALKVDPQSFLEAGRVYSSWVRDKLVTMGGMEVIKHTALAAVYAGVALPLSVYNGASMVLDSDFTRCREKAKMAGILLAEILERRVQGARPVRLIGYGPGATVLFRCLVKLHEKELGNLVYSAILIGLPESPSKVAWAAARSVVSHELVNCFSTNDWTLALHARLYTLSNRVGGLTEVEVEGVRDVDVSDLVQGHLEMRDKIDAVLHRVREGGGPVPTPEKE